MQLKTISDLENMSLIDLGKLRINDFQDKDPDFIKVAHRFFDNTIDEISACKVKACDSTILNQLKLIKLFLKEQVTPA